MLVVYSLFSLQCISNTLGSSKQRSNTDEFTTKARVTHGDTYDYHKVSYKDNNTIVTIIYKTHGEFIHTPAAHLVGKGCRECGKIISGSRLLRR